MDIKLNKNLKTPYYWQIADQIKRKIITGQLADGSVLPSERKLSSILGVHRNTIIRAYDTLKDADLIESRQGVGYLVSYGSSETEDLSENPRHKVNWSHAIKDEYLDMKETYDDIFVKFTEGNKISMSTGMPPAIYEEDKLGEDLASILNESAALPAYLAPYQGDTNLRQQLLAFLRTKGIKAGLGQLQVLSETNQAMDFLITALVSPGDCVIIEEPVSPDVYRAIQLAGCRYFTLPVDKDGMNCDNIESLIEKHEPKFIYVNSSYQDPTGVIMSMERRKHLLAISEKYRIPIIEEDAASELNYEDGAIPSIKSMDRNDNVIYIYSFSLTFIPGLSLALVVANERLIRSLSYLVSIRIMSINWMTQKLLGKYLADGRYYEKVEKIRKGNRQKRDVLCSYLDRATSIGVRYRKPRGGVYVWCQLPEGLNGMDVAEEATKAGITVVPGEVFYPMHNGGFDHLRLNYSYESTYWLSEGANRLVELLRTMYNRL